MTQRQQEYTGEMQDSLNRVNEHRLQIMSWRWCKCFDLLVLTDTERRQANDGPERRRVPGVWRIGFAGAKAQVARRWAARHKSSMATRKLFRCKDHTTIQQVRSGRTTKANCRATQRNATAMPLL
jgi:hypothetical protein